MPAHDAAPGGGPGGLDRAVLAELLDRFRTVVGGAAHQPSALSAGPDPISQWTVAEQGEGPPLCAVCDVLGPLPPDVVAALALQIAADLAQMHETGSIHRRLTPANVLLPDTGPKLVRSGVTRTVDGVTLTDLDGSLFTLAYLAPEQVLGLAVGPETDVFALGGVLAFAASGTPPFGSDEPLSVLYRIVNEDPALDAVPDSVRGLVKACLNRDPTQRPTLHTLTNRALGVLKDARGAHGQTADVAAVHDAYEVPDAHLVLTVREQTETRLTPTLLPTPMASTPIPVAHRRRRRTTNVAVLGTVAVGVAAAFLVRGIAESSAPLPTQSLTSPALLPAVVPATTAAAPLPGSFLAGPGCPASAWASITESIAPSGGLVPNVGGGFADCGGKAIAFVKTGATAPGASSFAWTFRLGRPAHCTLSVYIAAADSSSGYAHYRLAIPAASAGGPLFQINQSAANGQWVAAPELAKLSLPDGSVRLILTDAGAYPRDRFHVTASAVRASCSP